MLEINDFNAIRISLASPKDIETWTRGEVTKPETINYRTLKPERDGLFCERIFGPTKDWECYCGKYKRVRYKGVVCDKCGVEVTRSKVRRDRMGHIQLASPVSHIWFVKGTPSRLGLLLDISPRNLERVLYFAAYIITEIGDERLQAKRAEMVAAFNQRREEIQVQAEERRIELTSQLTQNLGDMNLAQMTAQSRIEEEHNARRKAFLREAEILHEQLEERTGEETEEDILFQSVVLVEEGKVISEHALDKLEEIVERELESLSALRERDVNDASLLTDAHRERKEHETTQEQERIQDRLQRELDSLLREERSKLESLDSLKLRRVLSEIEYRSLREDLTGFFQASMGAGAIREIVSQVDLDSLAEELQTEIQNTVGQRRKKATKRLRVVESFRKSGNRPEWMILTVLPVIPPDLRPMVQLDGGRFATSDLNDLYRRVINRNNRLKRLIELNAPEIIVRNEKRMLQEAVDALIDNGRRGRAVSGKGKHRLKSLSDMLKGKQGRFRQNLLGKRVDYSGRSVIVVGPSLRLHECGLPKKMALELFKPFVMRRLVEKGFAHNIKSAKRIVERVRPEVWDVLEEVIKDYLVLLNRAPSLHRLSIQAFEAKLIEGSAIQLHPLVCAAFNADFDGDQMAVHVPLSRKAQEEARNRMLSKYNLLSPAHGEPIITPSQDVVLGCYYLTMVNPNGKGAGKKFESPNEAMLAYDKGLIHLQAPIWVIVGENELCRFHFEEFGRYHDQVGPEDLRVLQGWVAPGEKYLTPDQFAAWQKMIRIFDPKTNDLRAKFLPRDGCWGILLETTIGRVILNRALLPPLRYRNELIAKKGLKEIIAECYKYYTNPPPEYVGLLRQVYKAKFRKLYEDEAEVKLADMPDQELARVFGSEMTAIQADMLKSLGFRYATRGGMTIGIDDIEVPPEKEAIVSAAEKQVADLEADYLKGWITADERYRQVVDVWQQVTKDVTEAVKRKLSPFKPVAMMAQSGARGNINQISQMAGMRGLMTDPTGRIIELPIKANFREGLTVLEYFVSTHGGRKGLADTALRTADAGYLTRRLVDVAQDVIVTIEDCGTEEGVWLSQVDDAVLMEPLQQRMIGRVLAAPVFDLLNPDPLTGKGKILAESNTEIEEELAESLTEAKVTAVYVRSALSCQAEHGICRLCYGRNLATGKLVEVGEAVGIIAAQSIGEPGTQLTLRTFHTGGVASTDDITQGLPRVQEIFEARSPKGRAFLSGIDGVVQIVKDDEGVGRFRITSTEIYTHDQTLPPNYVILVSDGDNIKEGQDLARSNRTDTDYPPLVARIGGLVQIKGSTISVIFEEPNDWISPEKVPVGSRIRVEDGEFVTTGQQLTDGSADPQELLERLGKEAVQHYLVKEAQGVYRSQGVSINDKHIEVIVRQMLRRVRIDEPGDTGLLHGELVDITEFRRINKEALTQGGDPAIAATILQGITKASLSTDSFLSAASFQETTRVLTEAAINGKVDYLRGLKENVVIGKLIPAGTGIEKHRGLKHSDMVSEVEHILDVNALHVGSASSKRIRSVGEKEDVRRARELLGISPDPVIEEPVVEALLPSAVNSSKTITLPIEALVEKFLIGELGGLGELEEFDDDDVLLLDELGELGTDLEIQEDFDEIQKEFALEEAQEEEAAETLE